MKTATTVVQSMPAITSSVSTKPVDPNPKFWMGDDYPDPYVRCNHCGWEINPSFWGGINTNNCLICKKPL